MPLLLHDGHLLQLNHGGGVEVAKGHASPGWTKFFGAIKPNSPQPFGKVIAEKRRNTKLRETNSRISDRPAVILLTKQYQQITAAAHRRWCGNASHQSGRGECVNPNA